MYSHPGDRTPSTPRALHKSSSASPVPRPRRRSPRGYLSRMASKYPNPLALYVALIRDGIRHIPRARRLVNLVMSLFMIVPLLGPFSGAPSATSFANLSSVGSSATTPPPTTFPENKSISVSGVPGNPDDPTVIEPGTDIFLNQPALTNNPYSCGTNCPDKANDGNDGTYWHDHNLSSNDYWRVALPYSASISSIRFIQGSSEYATTVDIYGSYTPTPGDNPDTHRVLLYDNLSVGPGTQIISIPYGMAFNYYYIQLQTWNDTAWDVYTIAGIAGDQPLPPPPNDVFKGRPASDNYCFGCSNPPTNANDGIDASFWGVSNPNSNNYWQVDLASAMAVNKLVMFQSPVDGYYATTFNILGSNGGSYTTIASNVTGTAGWQTINFTNTTAYLHYRIQGQTYNHGGIGGAWRVQTIQGYTGIALTQDEVRAPNALEPGCLRCDEGQPVNSATGNFWHTFNDLSVPGRGIPLQYRRTYNSLADNENSRLGYGWTDSYNIYIITGTTVYSLYEGNGSVAPFPITNTQYSRVEASLLRNPDGTFVVTTTHGLDRYYFTSAGKLSQMANRNGYTTTLSYDTNGLLQSVTDPSSRQLTFSYTLTGTTQYLTGVTDPAGHTVSFGYDNSGNLQTATDVGGNRTGFTYDGSHRLQTMTDPNNGVLTNQYDSQSRVTQQTDQMGRTLNFGYASDSVSATTRITNTLGLVAVQYYTDYLPVRVVQSPGPNQAVTDFTYQPGTTFLSSTQDPNGNTWHFVYDNAANLLSVTDPLTRTTSYAYNATNDLTVVTDTRGLTTTFGYDAYGNVTTVTQPITETSQLITTTLTYDPIKPGDVLTVTNPLGNSWGTRYDAYGNVLTATNPLGQSSQFTYNSIGWVLSATTPRTYTSTFSYTPYGEPQLVTDTLGYTTVFTYDNVGNLINARDANSRVVTNTYDLDNEVTRATLPDGTHSDYGYDGLGRTITQTNGLGQLSRYTYDDLNRVITYTDALTRSTVSKYGLAGNLTTVIDAKNQTTTLGYDAAYQLKNINYSDGTTPNVSFLYNSLGMRTVMTDGTGTNTYTYDSLNRLTSVQNGHGDAVTYAYDIASRPITVTYPYNGVSTRNVVRGYNAADQLTSVRDWLSNTTTFGYNADGALTTITRPNGANTSVGYNAADQVITKTDAITSTPFLSFTFQIDPVGVLNSAAEANTAGSVGTHTYNYDTRYRLAQDNFSVSAPTTNTWQYDAATQILTTTYQAGGAGTPINGVRTYDAANEIRSLVETQGVTTLKSIKYTFDNDGNRTQRSDKVGTTSNYTYDQANRLISYNSAFQYRYSGDGLRMIKSNLITGRDIFFAWDIGVEAGEPLLLQETTASYIYGPGGAIVEQIDGSNNAYYYHTDQLGSARALTDGSGAVVNTYTYDAYGKTLSQTGTVYSPFGYTGEYTDQESGFIFLRARYYDPESQQFLTVDPALASTQEAYAYVGGSPTNFRDPSGLDANCSLWPNPFDEHSCIREGFDTPAGKIVTGIGVIAAGGVVVACFASGVCEVAGGVAAGAAAGAAAEPVAEPAIEKEVVQPLSSWVVRAGEPTIRNLTNGYSGGGLSVQFNPGSSVDYLATMGEFPNAQVCFAQYPTLVERTAQLGYTAQIVQTEGGGLYHHELVVQGLDTLPEPIARLWSEIFGPTLQENPLRYLPGGR